MHALKAHVKSGQIIVDGTVDLPDGTELEVYIDDLADENMSDEERAELEAAIEEGLADADAGRVVDASVVLEKLRARSSA